MKSAEINRRFTDYFERHGHLVMPSASLISSDPTTLFVIAGMAPMKPYFLAQEPPPAPRATTIQKVVRTPDIEEVGVTARHLTFFQMAGNFSFGDYFKQGAITMAWELLTSSRDDGGFGFDPERLWATVYQDDDEAFGIWTDVVGLPAERVQRRGMEDNFWSMGVPGPCGPCSEIYFDRGPAYGKEGGPVVDEDRYLEVWNLVFMQFERGPGAGKTDFPILGDLPAKNIDTGMGVERMAVVLQGVDNVYETDLLRPILDTAARLTGTSYGAEHQIDVRLRVIADHMRTATMLVADGVTPGNESRGYVLRRILRRVIRNARILGASEAVMADLLDTTIDVMCPSYPQLEREAQRIESVVTTEEQSFLATLRSGTARFEAAVGDAQRSGGVVPGDRAFELHDTFGFPIDLTLEMAAEAGLTVDEEGFRRLMQDQRDRAKRDAYQKKVVSDLSAYRGLLDGAGEPEFTGYAEVVTDATVRGILRRGESVPAAGEGDEIELVLDRTPFYAEAGGQLADTGVIRLSNGAEVEVLDVQKPVTGLIVHRAVVRSGEVVVDTAARAEVDIERRRAISRAHTATHLIHRAMRGALGETATQAGSLNAPGRLRFDFAAPSAVPPKVLLDVEDEVNAILIDDLEVRAFVTDQAEARRLGALALFGEKYGDRVRIVEVGDYARELCGGTHAARSGQLGLVKVLSESSSAAGVRRVEALVGLDAFRFLAREHVLLDELTALVKAQDPRDLPERISGLTTRLRDAERELEKLRAAAVLASAPQLVSDAVDVNGGAVIRARVADGVAAGDLRTLALDVRGRFPAEQPVAVALVSAQPDSGAVPVVISVNEAAQRCGLAAGDLMRAVAPELGGRGGGRADVAQGSGSDATKADKALDVFQWLVGEKFGG